MSKKKKNFRNKKIFGKFILVVLCTLVTITSITYSWFTKGYAGFLEELTVDVIGSADVYISLDQEKWTKQILLSTKNKMISEFSGDGRSFFYPLPSGGFDENGKPKINSYYRIIYPETMDPKDYGYIDVQLYLKTDKAVKLYLSPEPNACSIYPADYTNKQDKIVGALRLAIATKNNTYMWIPNTTYEYKDGEVNTNGKVEDQYTFIESNLDYDIPVDSMHIVNTKGQASGYDTTGRILWGDLSKIDDYYNSVQPILVTQNFYGSSIMPMNIRIWVEGTDRECVNDLINGKFRFKLNFQCVTTEKVSG